MSKWPDMARWVGTSHHGGAMTGHRGLVVHIAEGFLNGTIAWQQGDNSVSSHFIVGRNGDAVQMVDTADESWAQKAGNPEWLSVECEGFTSAHVLHKDHPGWEVLSAQQIEKIAHLLAKGSRQYGYALQLAVTPSGTGLGHHSMGADWGHQDCPGPPIIAQKPLIVNRARQINGVPQTVNPPTVQLGSKGRYVRLAQVKLNEVPDTGADVAVDGVFGPKTQAKTERVQQHFRVAVDGVIGPITWARMGVH